MGGGDDLAHQVYAAAGRAGFLLRIYWLRQGDRGGDSAYVSLAQEDHLLRDGLARSTDLVLRYPSNQLLGLRKGDLLEVAGKRYQVREIISLGNGAVTQVKVTKL